MKYSNNDISILDNEMVGKNIKRILNNRNIPQKEIYTKAGIAQPDFSKRINGKAPFSLENIYNIAIILHVSIDDLLGLNNQQQEKSDTLSLSDACEALVNLGTIVSLKFGTLELENSDENSDAKKKTYCCIYSKNKRINDMINKFSQLYSLKDEAIIELWKNDFKEKNKIYLRNHDYKTEYEYAEFCLNYWIECTYDYALVCQNSDNSLCHSELDAVCEKVFRTLLCEGKGAKNIKIMNKFMNKFYNEKKYFSSSPESISLGKFEQIYERFTSTYPENSY